MSCSWLHFCYQWFVDIILSSLKSSVPMSKQKHFFFSEFVHLIFNWKVITWINISPLLTAIIKAGSFKLIYYYFTMYCERGIMIHKFADSLFPAADTSPSAKTQTAVLHLSECQASSNETKRERASTQPTETAQNVCTLFHERVYPTIILRLYILFYTSDYLLVHPKTLKE